MPTFGFFYERLILFILIINFFAVTLNLEPIVAPIKKKKFALTTEENPETTYDLEYSILIIFTKSVV